MTAELDMDVLTSQTGTIPDTGDGKASTSGPEKAARRSELSETYIFDIVIGESEHGIDVRIPDLDISFKAQGEKRDAIKKAISLARGETRRRMALRQPIPQSTETAAAEDSKTVTIAFDAEFPSEDFFTVEDAMELLNVSQPRVSFLIQGGKLQAVKVGRRHLIPRESLLSYMASPRTPGRPRKHPEGILISVPEDPSHPAA